MVKVRYALMLLLQKLHPHVPSWGSLLRLYGNTADRGQCAKVRLYVTLTKIATYLYPSL